MLLRRIFPNSSLHLMIALLLLLPGPLISQTLKAYKEGGKYGFKTLYGKVVVKPEFDGTGWAFSQGLISVQKGNKWGVMNSRGELVAEIRYDEVGWYTGEGLALAKLNGLCGFIDTSGNIVIPLQFQESWGFMEGMARVKKNGKWGFIDSTGKVIIPLEYDDFEFPQRSEVVFGACKDRKWGFINRDNKVIIPFEYDKVGSFSEGLALASESFMKWGYIDINNRRVIPFKYDYPGSCDGGGSDFRNGIAQVSYKDRSGYVNKRGKTVIPFKYSCLGAFYNGYASAQTSNGEYYSSDKYRTLKYGYIDSLGNEYLEDHQDFSDHDWKVGPAPKEIPDLSAILKTFQSNQREFLPQMYYDSFSIDSTGKESSFSVDTVWIRNSGYVAPEPDTVRKWTLEKILNLSLSSFRQEPKSYPAYKSIKEVSIAYGILMGGDFGGRFMHPDPESWEIFKKETAHKVISDEKLRNLTWCWAGPYYHQSFNTLHSFHKQAYRDIAVYLKKYINSYDIEKVKAHLEKNEAKFAYFDTDGKYDPCRKLSSFIDRLIVVHNVLTVEDAKIWVNRIGDEVLSW
jgi:hypothetical protein